MSSATHPDNQTRPAASDGRDSAIVLDFWEPDIRAIQQIEAVPRILEAVCGLTGMGLAAVARVTEERWVCCAVRDRINFGMMPGSEMDSMSTICHEIRQSHQPVVIDEVAMDVTFTNLHKRLHRFQSYISVPIMLKDGAFFGTLCAADPKPARLNNPETLGTIRLFADLIASELNSARSPSNAHADFYQEFVTVLDHDLRNPLKLIATGVQMLSARALDGDTTDIVSLIGASTERMSRLIDAALGHARSRRGGV